MVYQVRGRESLRRLPMNRHLAHVLLSLVVAAGYQREPPPSHIFHTGKIVTVDPQFRTVEAMAIRGRRIAATGTNADILKLAGSDTQQVNLGGRTVLPGLIDSHVHAPSASMYEFEQPVPDMENIGDVLAYFRERARTTDPGRWITLSQVFITRLREQRYPTRAELDTAAPRHPAAFRTGPDASLNSLALSMSGIDAKFRVPDGEPCRVERDASGQPTGILRNCGRYIRSGPGGSSPTAADRLARLRELLADYNAVGITSIVDANADQGGLELYRTLLAQNALTCRTFMAYGVDAQAPLDRIEADDSRGSRSIRCTGLRFVVVAARREGIPGWRHAHRERLHAGAVGPQQDLLDRRPDYRGIRYIERSGLSRREAGARERLAIHGAFPGQRDGPRAGRSV